MNLEGFPRTDRTAEHTPPAGSIVTSLTTGFNPAFPWTFVALAFGINWLLLAPAVLASAGWIQLPIPTIALYFALVTPAQFAPSLAAFILTFGSERWAGVKRLLARAFNARFPLRWLGVIVLGPLALGALALGLHVLAGGRVPPSALLYRPSAIIPSALVVFFFLGPVPEEFGWRGYLLDRLQARRSALSASLILGALWAVWHLPAWFVNGSFQYLLPFWAFVVWDIALTVLITWIYNNTGRNLLAALLVHTFVNVANVVFPPVEQVVGASPRGFLYLTALYVIAAVVVVAIWGPQRLTRRPVADSPSAKPVEPLPAS